ncbi:putative Serine/threonine-protein kinase [Monocercomonoides exilis]|uniref:putative Serine/threonine-protein kinase n=1 Tax=Monocercomonoides exilis TaxID=2049356 RepID=UPI00355ABE68|nr:putative Serine/threonine-protein kinase [Monocercomonoides exilis]|eukprot:MONOS_10385.1-p1 / transcript=MONOS_10385.1 / gene=MONOS_10385 / organism=Monocercomonoides_exilis_PA203 / gene_product=Similar to Derlin-2 / transcript_product=Similar to Derlin-2 / location=Mono_scaffold00470:4079-5053(+) / protein_length=247 / sequence_SO=supercontig / SO=protein_coding / is_pseudo=false
MEENGNWLRAQIENVPPFTRMYDIASIVLSLLIYSGNLSLIDIFFHPVLVIEDKQYWRLFTSFLYHGEFGLNLIINLYFFSNMCSSLETNHFRNRTIDFAFFVFFIASVIVILSLIPTNEKSHPILAHSLSSAFWYYSSKLPENRHGAVMLFMLIQVPFSLVAWIQILFKIVSGESIMDNLKGILAGHLFYYFERVLCDDYIGGPNIGKALNSAKQFVIGLFHRGEEANADGQAVIQIDEPEELHED